MSSSKNTRLRLKRILKLSQKGSERRDIFLKSPNEKEGRAKFSIIERTRRPDGKSSNKTLKFEALDAINLQYQQKQISFDQARLLVKELISQLTPQTAVLHNQANLKVLENYWEQEYANRDLVDPASAKNRLLRAIEAVGHYSLLAASRTELQKEIDSRFKGNKHRSVVSALNQILRFLGRDVKLRRAREEVKAIRYVTESELTQLVSHISDPIIRTLHLAAFGSGLRLGELFSLRIEHIKEDYVLVDSQMDRQTITRKTKNRRDRKAYIIPNFRSAIVEWANIPQEKKLKIRSIAIAKITQKAAKAALGRACAFHDLRHSYAVYLVSQGVSLSHVAQSIGDSVLVAERYYSGFVLTSESIELISSILKRVK